MRLKNFELPMQETKQQEKKKDQDKMKDSELHALQNAIRSQSQELLQVSSLLGQLNQQFEFEKTNIKRLQLEMEKVGAHLKKYAP